MTKYLLPVGLPDSLLVNELATKTSSLRTAPSRTPGYIEWLKALRDRIVPELGNVNVTFPLFTPHDEQNHIHPLFTLTERLIGPEVLRSLNATELFVLACSLYAHDWGMAVSEQEKECLLGMAEPASNDSFSLLGDDRNAFARVLNECRTQEAPKVLEDVPAHVWRSYFRKTHAARSGQRVRAFFSSIDLNLGEAVALVCEAHALDLEQIRFFDTALPLQSEVVNVRALALYLRIVDLFDLAQDRTPYALWKFVNPRDPTSAEEWSKHRTLSPVAVEQFQGTSRCIKVRGMTDDHRVYAALEDLREYCDHQLRLSNGLLNELTVRYHLRLLHLDWKVDARGFEPVNVRLEFDRQAMIKVLSDEIYQGDRYVFLRELLQNSIDAIRLRRALHKKNNTGVKFQGAIQVEVEHRGEGRAVVTWTDNGSGMNTFIVRNYLTVAGKSFYQSQDFQKLGVEMDPISRFGIGILSCFMVAERVEIITRQDPHIEASPEALNIEIHDPERYLRIQRCAPHQLPPVGTTVKVFVERTSPNGGKKSSLPRFDLTGYLKEIAGFVEFPIYVKEHGKQTVILHPGASRTSKKMTGWDVATLDCSFAWQDWFYPQDVSQARSIFTENRIAIKSSPKNSVFEGTISKAVLDKGIELKRGRGSHANEESLVATRKNEKLGTVRIRDLETRSLQKVTTPFRSMDCNNSCRIYSDGILVPGVSPPEWIGRGWRSASTMRIVLNIRRTAGIRLDLSRHDILAATCDWREFVLQRCVAPLRRKTREIVARGNSKDAFYRLCHLVTYGTGLDRPFDFISDLAIPLVVLDERGRISVVKPASLTGDVVNIVPHSLAEDLSEQVFEGWTSDNWLRNKRIPWNGGLSIFADRTSYHVAVEGPRSVSTAEMLQKRWLVASYDLKAVRFLSPGDKEKAPLIQEVWISKNRQRAEHGSDKVPEVVRTAQATIRNLSKLMESRHFGYGAPTFTVFLAPFEAFFTAGWWYLNVRHCLVQALSDCIEAVTVKQAADGIKEHNVGRIQDVLNSLFDYRPMYYVSSKAKIEEKCERLRQLFDLASRVKDIRIARTSVLEQRNTQRSSSERNWSTWSSDSVSHESRALASKISPKESELVKPR